VRQLHKRNTNMDYIAEQPKIEMEKCKVPIVWIDTSIITNICIYKEDPSKFDDIAGQRIKSIYELIYKSTRAGKIICPLAEQDREVWIGRDDWLKTINDLGLAIKCSTTKKIEDRQIQSGMEAFINSDNTFSFETNDMFDGDPIYELENALKEPFIIYVTSDIVYGADYNRKKNKQLLKDLNKAREVNVLDKVTYKKQFEIEYEWSLKILLKMCFDYMHGLANDEDEEENLFWGTVNLAEKIDLWNKLKGEPTGIEGLINFYNSNYFKKLPYVYLQSSLFAKIMIDPQPIKSGDSMDIKHISFYMPYSDLFITDKPWRTYLRSRKFDKMFNTSVCYIGDTEDINNFFINL